MLEVNHRGKYMKIGIDAKWFFDGPPSGKIVVRNLVKNIILLNDCHELFIFLDKKYKDDVFPYNNPKVKLVYVWANNNLLSNLIVIPFVAFSYKLDIFISQNFSPFVSNFKRYSFVHDVIFKSHPEYYTNIERLYFTPLKFLTNRAHGVCTVSNAEATRMKHYGYGAKKRIDVVYHGVDDSFKPIGQQDIDRVECVKQKYALPDKFLLYVGRLNVRKNIFNLLHAFSLLKHNIPLVIVGGYDWKMTNVDDLLKQLRISDRLIFTGPVFGEDLSVIYSMSHVFCFPSYEESFGIPALEGMASGVPVVVSNRSSLPEICGDAGNYVNPDSPQNIADVIDNLIDNEGLRHEKILAGLRQSKKFRWEFSSNELMRNVWEVCNKGLK